MIDRQPKNKLADVSILGICSFISFILMQLQINLKFLGWRYVPSLQNTNKLLVEAYLYLSISFHIFGEMYKTHFRVLLPILMLTYLSCSAQRKPAFRGTASYAIAYPTRSKIVRLPIDTTHAEIINNSFNVSFMLSNGDLLQLNNIPHAMLLDTSWKSAEAQMVYMPLNGSTLSSTKPIKIRIWIKAEGLKKQITIHAVAKLISSVNSSNTIEMQYNGPIPNNEDIKTYQIDIKE
jgi:hypothetical protein